MKRFREGQAAAAVVRAKALQLVREYFEKAKAPNANTRHSRRGARR
jgi:hypothetical protein